MRERHRQLVVWCGALQAAECGAVHCRLQCVVWCIAGSRVWCIRSLEVSKLAEMCTATLVSAVPRPCYQRGNKTYWERGREREREGERRSEKEREGETRRRNERVPKKEERVQARG